LYASVENRNSTHWYDI